MTGNRASLAACFIRTFFLAWIWLAVIRGLLIIQSGVLPSLPGTLGGDVAGAFCWPYSCIYRLALSAPC